jgi:dTDP-4-amino-4,6-dideoxygalactose transaminase
MNKIEMLTVSRQCRLREALTRMDQGAKGLLLLIDADGCFERTVTDGDLRRLLLKGATLEDTLQSMAAMTSHVIADGATRREALDMMNKYGINHLPVIGPQGRVVDVLDRKQIDAQILLSTPHMGDSERRYVEDAFKTNWIAPLGPNVDAFECELAEMVGVRHAAALSSGTAALHLGLRLLGVGTGDKVFCSTFTFAASANPIMYQGAEPVFIDSDHDSWNMSPQALERAFEIARREGWMPKAVIIVCLYGQSANMEPLMALCQQYNVPVLEDAAESLGATYNGKASGTFGRLGVFSFNGNKIITTSGGGMLVSDDPDLIAKARFLSTQARDPAPHYQHSEIGFNYRMSNILAGIGRGQLHVLRSRVEARRQVFQVYREQLSELDCITWMPEPSWSYSTHWLTACTITPRVDVDCHTLMKYLASELIEARPLWKPMHLQPVFQGCRYFAHGDVSVSNQLFDQGLCLPSGSNMSTSDVERIVDVIRRFLR